jgi:hypothetical protein
MYHLKISINKTDVTASKCKFPVVIKININTSMLEQTDHFSYLRSGMQHILNKDLNNRLCDYFKEDLKG